MSRKWINHSANVDFKKVQHESRWPVLFGLQRGRTLTQTSLYRNNPWAGTLHSLPLLRTFQAVITCVKSTFLETFGAGNQTSPAAACDPNKGVRGKAVEDVLCNYVTSTTWSSSVSRWFLLCRLPRLNRVRWELMGTQDASVKIYG